MILQQLANGLVIGVIYAIIGIGFSLVWVAARTMNFAYGVTYTLGAYAFYFVVSNFHLDSFSIVLIVVLIAITVILGLAIGYGSDRLIFRPLRGNAMAPMFATFGMAVVIESLLVILVGAGSLTVNVAGAQDFINLGPVTFTWIQVFLILASIAIMVVVHFWVRRTRTGRAMRAVAFDREAAELMGIRVNTVLIIVFIVASILAVWAGVAVALLYGVVSPYMGSAVLVKGLAAAIVGGFGSITGAVIGGLSIGVLEAVGASLSSSGNWQDVVAYGVLIVFVLVRPAGIFGRRGGLA
jgi:branched-chain amino acid transport system permease protein